MSNNNDENNVDNANQNAGNAGAGNADLNGGNGDGSQKTVPLATFLELKNELKSLKDKNQSYELERKKAEEAKLKEQGDLQKLLDAKEKELEELNAKVKNLETKATAFDELENQERADAKKTLGDNWDEGYNDIPIKTLRKLVNTVKTPSAIGSDNGGGEKPKPTELTNEQKAQAKQMGLSDEGYSQYLKKREERKKN